jgi:hypothetical protein
MLGAGWLKTVGLYNDCDTTMARAPQGGSEPIEDGCGAPTKIHSMDGHRVIEPGAKVQITGFGFVAAESGRSRINRARCEGLLRRGRQGVAEPNCTIPEGAGDAIPKIEMIIHGGRRQKSFWPRVEARDDLPVQAKGIPMMTSIVSNQDLTELG